MLPDLTGGRMRIFLVAVLLLFGCDMNTPEDVIEVVNRVTGQEEPAPLPELGPPLLIEDGVRLYELLTSQETEQIWIALPPAGENALSDGAIPCVLLPPLAMDRALGGRLGSEDLDQLLLFARSGVAAAAFDVPGAWVEGSSPSMVQAEMERYMADDGGLRTARQVLDVVLARLPEADPARLWVLGEGAAGTLALRLAGRDARIKAVVAFDPVSDMLALAGMEELAPAFQASPGLKDFLRKQSLQEALDRLRCPVLLFHDAFRHEKNFEDIDHLYLEALRLQKDVSMIDTLNVDPAHAGLASRTSRSLRWLESLNHPKH